MFSLPLPRYNNSRVETLLEIKSSLERVNHVTNAVFDKIEASVEAHSRKMEDFARRARDLQINVERIKREKQKEATTLRITKPLYPDEDENDEEEREGRRNRPLFHDIPYLTPSSRSPEIELSQHHRQTSSSSSSTRFSSGSFLEARSSSNSIDLFSPPLKEPPEVAVPTIALLSLERRIFDTSHDVSGGGGGNNNSNSSSKIPSSAERRNDAEEEEYDPYAVLEEYLLRSASSSEAFTRSSRRGEELSMTSAISNEKTSSPSYSSYSSSLGPVPTSLLLLSERIFRKRRGNKFSKKNRGDDDHDDDGEEEEEEEEIDFEVGIGNCTSFGVSNLRISQEERRRGTQEMSNGKSRADDVGYRPRFKEVSGLFGLPSGLQSLLPDMVIAKEEEPFEEYDKSGRGRFLGDDDDEEEETNVRPPKQHQQQQTKQSNKDQAPSLTLKISSSSLIDSNEVNKTDSPMSSATLVEVSTPSSATEAKPLPLPPKGRSDLLATIRAVKPAQVLRPPNVSASTHPPRNVAAPPSSSLADEMREKLARRQKALSGERDEEEQIQEAIRVRGRLPKRLSKHKKKTSSSDNNNNNNNEEEEEEEVEFSQEDDTNSTSSSSLPSIIPTKHHTRKLASSSSASTFVLHNSNAKRPFEGDGDSRHQTQASMDQVFAKELKRIAQSNPTILDTRGGKRKQQTSAVNPGGGQSSSGGGTSDGWGDEEEE